MCGPVRNKLGDDETGEERRRMLSLGKKVKNNNLICLVIVLLN